MIARRSKRLFSPSDPRAVHRRFQKIAVRAAERAQQELALIKPPPRQPSQTQPAA